MITSVSAFLDYFEGVRRRTLTYIRAVPSERVHWQPKVDEFTCGEIVRHLGAAELMYAGVLLDQRWHYPGHAADGEDTMEAAVAHLNACHAQAVERLRTLPDSDLMQPRPSVIPEAPPVKAWRWLMAMCEHETHHRSQLASYMMLMGVEPPQIYGLKLEDLIDYAEKS